VNSKKLGRWLASVRHRVIGDLRLSSIKDTNKKINVWFVDRV